MTNLVSPRMQPTPVPSSSPNAEHGLRAKLGQRIDPGHVLAAAGAIVLPLQVISWPSVALVLVLAALATVVVKRPNWPTLPWLLVAILGALVALAAASATWALSPKDSIRLAFWLLGIFATGLVLVDAACSLDAPGRRHAETGLIIGFLLAILLLGILLLTKGAPLQALRDLDLFKRIFRAQRPITSAIEFDRSMAFLALMIWPVTAIFLRRGRLSQGLIAAALGYGIILQGLNTTAKMAVVASAVVFALAYFAPKLTTWAMAATLALTILAAPLIFRTSTLGWVPQSLPIYQGKAPSLEHRLAIWGFVIDRIDEHPLFGWGIDSSRRMPGGHVLFAHNSEMLPLHPHNAALQLRLDLGLPGAILGALFVLGLAWRIVAGLGRNRVAVAFSLALATSATAMAMMSFNLWHIWWQSMLWMAATFGVMAFTAIAHEGDAALREKPARR